MVRAAQRKTEKEGCFLTQCKRKREVASLSNERFLKLIMKQDINRRMEAHEDLG